MENCKNLPEAVIQHIQSFLSGKDAAKTSILSKNWYSAWLTRPNLDFDRRHFSSKSPAPCNENGFWEFVEKATQRYEELNRKIDSFRLWVYSKGSDEHSDIAGNLILKAMKLGATDIEFEQCWGSKVFALPREVLCSETLTRLSVGGCRIDLGSDRKVSCSRLKSLIIRSGRNKDEVVHNLSCPLIEILSLSLNWRKVPTFNDPMGFHKLKCLVLKWVGVDALFFRDLSSKFPCLKDLSVHHFIFHGDAEIQISSTSLECISFDYTEMLTATFDVPCLRKLKFKGSYLPCFTFKQYSREWKSDISIWVNFPNPSWFIRLKELLAKLSQHEISLSFNIWGINNNGFDYANDVEGLHTPIVLKHLVLRNLGQSVVSSAFLDGLFWSCRPKLITVDLTSEHDFPDTLCKTLIDRVSENSCIPNRKNLGLHDLDEVNVEIFNKRPAEWRPLPLETMLDASIRRESVSQIRFHMRWR